MSFHRREEVPHSNRGQYHTTGTSTAVQTTALRYYCTAVESTARSICFTPRRWIGTSGLENIDIAGGSRGEKRRLNRETASSSSSVDTAVGGRWINVVAGIRTVLDISTDQNHPPC